MSIRATVVIALLAASALSAQTQVADVATEPRSTFPGFEDIVQVGAYTCFVANFDDSGYGIWKSDGTAEGTQIVVDMNASSHSFYHPELQLLAGLNGELYFLANLHVDETGPAPGLWRTDSSSGGVVLVKKVGPFDSFPQAVTTNGKLFFGHVDSTYTGNELWVTDGSAEGTWSLTEPIDAEHPYNLTVAGNDVYFTATAPGTGTELWVSDGTVAGTHIVSDLNPGSASSMSSSITSGYSMVEFNGELWFTADDGSSGTELWKTDGTSSGTTPAIDVNPGSGDSNLAHLEVHNGELYFAAGDSYSRSLWKTDGSNVGTVELADFGGQGAGSISQLTSTPLGLIFAADDGWRGTEPWITDGTSAGTELLRDLNPYGYSYPGPFVYAGNYVYFTANGPYPPYKRLYKTDGTTAGTTLVGGDYEGAHFVHGNGNMVLFAESVAGHYTGSLWGASGDEASVVKTLVSDAGSLLNSSGDWGDIAGDVGSGFVFAGSTEGHPDELWMSDGSSSGTTELELNAPGSSSMSGPQSFVSHEGLAYFQAYDLDYGAQMWRTDGTPWGTVRLTTFGSNGSGSTAVGVIDDKMVFYGLPYNETPRIGTSDGTVGGTVSFAIPSLESIEPRLVDGGKFYFSATSTSNEREIWISDGTPQGTAKLVSDWWDWSSYFSWRAPGDAHDSVFFLAEDSTHGRELRRTDGTPQGTVLVQDSYPGPDHPPGGQPGSLDAAATDDVLLYAGTDGVNGIELWATDGTSSGTAMLKDILPGSGGSAPSGLTEYNGRVYFAAETPDHGRELWVSDGTALGTQLLADIYPGILSSNPAEFFEHDGLLYFSAINDTHGRELWKTDGSAEGTVRVSDINPGRGNASPADFFEVDGDLYFLAYRPSDGREFWRLGTGGRGGDSGGSGCVVRTNNNGTLFVALALLSLLGAGALRQHARRRSNGRGYSSANSKYFNTCRRDRHLTTHVSPASRS